MSQFKEEAKTSREYLLAQTRELKMRMSVEFVDPDDYVRVTVGLERAYVDVLDKLAKLGHEAHEAHETPNSSSDVSLTLT
jgi:hypothetical protein